MKMTGKFSRSLALMIVTWTLWAAAVWAEEQVVQQYEYKIVPLGSLSSLAKTGSAAEKSAAAGRIDEIEGLLNEQGLDGWEIVNIFAVRTTFDPNVFFVAMKRPLLKDVEEEQP